MDRDSKGRFIKGNKPWHSGKKGVYSLETREKMRNKKLRKGHINKSGYRVLRILSSHIFEHHLVWMKANHLHRLPYGYIIYHINQNKLDNRIANLQLMDNSFHTKLHWEFNKSNGVIL